MSPKAFSKRSSTSQRKKATERSCPEGTAKRAARVSAAAKKSQRPYSVRKQPRQERSQQMVAAILQAAAEVFAQLGYARATTNKIAQRAGVSVGSLYQYFPNKDSLLLGLLEQHHADVDRVIRPALARLADPGVSLDDGLRCLLTELLALHSKNPALTRALSSEVAGQSPAMEQAHKTKEHDHQVQHVSKILRSRSDVRSGNHLAMAALLGQTTSHLTRWLVHDVPAGWDQDQLVEEAVLLLRRYLEK